MSAQRIRPSLADLASEYDQPAFPELEQGSVPAARVSRTRPPAIAEAATTLPPPIPVVAPREATPTPSTSSAPPAKPKSRFALQREKEAAEKAQRNERFEINLDDMEAALQEDLHGSNSDRKVQAAVVKGIKERPLARKAVPPAPPSAPGPSRPLAFGSRPTGFPAPARGVFPRKVCAASQAPLATSATAPAPARRPIEPYSPSDPGSDADSLLRDVSRENEGVLSSLSEAEILEEQRQIREELGLSDNLLKMLQSRAEKRAQASGPSRPTPTPRSRPAAVPAVQPPADFPEDGEEVDEEGTPEYIRRHFFPNEPPNSALDWMKPAPVSGVGVETLPAGTGVSFNLRGEIVANEGVAMPTTFAGDHHVSSSTTFTLPSLLALTSSAIPSQRSTAFQVLARVMRAYDQEQLRLERKELATLRADCVTCACHALRESNVSVLMTAIKLLLAVLAAELCSSEDTDSLDRAMPTSVGVLIEMNPFPRLADHLSSGRDALPRETMLDILHILSTLVTMSIYREGSEVLDILVATPGLLDAVNRRFLATAWPPQENNPDEMPEVAASVFLSELARSSRAHAKVVAGQSLVESHLRFLAVPSWELPAKHRAEAQGLEMATFVLWSTLGRYGLATTLRTQAGDLLDVYSQRLADLRRDISYLEPAGDLRSFAAYLNLLSVWTTAAIDPHVTGHDITWSQVEMWRDVGLEAHELAFAALHHGADEEDVRTLLAAAWDLLGSWLEGSKVNKSWRGEHERRWTSETFAFAFATGGQAHKVFEHARHALVCGEDLLAARVVATALRLSEAAYETSDPPTPQLLDVETKTLIDLSQAITCRSAPNQASTAVLEFALRRLAPADRIPLAIAALPLFSASDAVVARDLVEEVITFAAKGESTALIDSDAFDARDKQALAEVGHLRPFVTHAIVLASAGKVVGPLFPTPRDIKLSACLPRFGSKGPILRSDWPLSVLDELLRSADSQVFQRLPADWNVSEVQLVRSALVLTRFILEVGKSEIDPTSILYNLIKVFMLEKDNSGTTTGSSGAEREVFRDDVMQRSLASLLGRLSICSRGAQRLKRDERSSMRTLEGVSARISSAPFFQLYQDLIGLYDSISLSDRNFGLVLLPPLAMAYPVDYRRLLWTDFAHLLPHLSFSIDEAVSDAQDGEGSLAGYLEPRETSAPVLTAYVEALVGGKISPAKTPFLHLIAVHHLSRAIFAPDLAGEERQLAERLVRTLVACEAAEALRTVLGYRQADREGDELVLPPACYGAPTDSARLLTLEELAGKELEAKVANLLRQ
ncbi:hypothetical protein JCM10908_004938 [Rhodotorula pacifica]|uniref:uncharacterized protein n=1 Tax=Rhodotorula pacifica TaxID=1495444 RepID=UPI0031729E39